MTSEAEKVGEVAAAESTATEEKNSNVQIASEPETKTEENASEPEKAEPVENQESAKTEEPSPEPEPVKEEEDNVNTESSPPKIEESNTQQNEQDVEMAETQDISTAPPIAVQEAPASQTIDESEFDRSLAGFQSIQDRQFTCDSDYETLVRQMVSDIPLQRLVSTKQLIPSAKRFGPAAMKSLINQIKMIGNDKEIVIRQTLASQLGGLADYFKTSCPLEEAIRIIIDDILPCIQKMLLDNVEVRQSASKSLVQIAEILPPESVHEHVLRIVLHLAHDEMDEHKITALPLLGDLAPVVGPNICASYLASDLHALSQDNSFRVRKATVQVFGAVCKQMGPDKTENQMLDLYNLLATDNIWSVRKGCVESIVELSKAVNENIRPRLVTLMENFLKDTSRWVRNTAYEYLGPFLATLSSEQISPEFLKSFTNIPKLKSAEADTESCNHCAYNFPAVVQTVGKERWGELREAYMLLLKKTFKSRKTLACSLHEIAKILGTEITEKDLMQAFELFHKDIDDIREGVLKNFAFFLEVLSPKKREEHLATLWEISSEMDANWRFRLLLAGQISKIMTLYEADTVSEQIIPLAFQLCDDKMCDVRYQATQSIPDLLKCMKEKGNPQQYAETLKKTRSLATNRTYAKRQLYVDLCRHALEKIDNEIFEQELLESLLACSRDPVPNVRLMLAKLVKEKLRTHEYFGTHQEVVRVIDEFKSDPSDVEVVRLFSTDDELKQYIARKVAENRGTKMEEVQVSSDSDSEIRNEVAPPDIGNIMTENEPQAPAPVPQATAPVPEDTASPTDTKIDASPTDAKMDTI